MSGDVEPQDVLVQEAMDRIRAKFNADRPPYRFSPESLGVINERQTEYVEDLASAAIDVARRRDADVVSVADVRKADQSIRVAERLRGSRMFEVLGALLAGGGFGLLLTQWAQAASATTTGWVLGGAVTTLGLMSVVWGIASQRA
jgi:hypothetical protein